MVSFKKKAQAFPKAAGQQTTQRGGNSASPKHFSRTQNAVGTYSS